MGGETALIRGSTPQPPCTPSPTTPEKALLPSPYSSCQPPCLHGTPTPPPLHLAPASSWHLIMAPHRLCATLLGPLETPPHLPSTVTHCQSVLDPGGSPSRFTIYLSPCQLLTQQPPKSSEASWLSNALNFPPCLFLGGPSGSSQLAPPPRLLLTVLL